MAQHLGADTDLTENLGSIPSTHLTALNPVPEDLTPSSGLFRPLHLHAYTHPDARKAPLLADPSHNPQLCSLVLQLPECNPRVILHVPQTLELARLWPIIPILH